MIVTMTILESFWIIIRYKQNSILKSFEFFFGGGLGLFVSYCLYCSCFPFYVGDLCE
jgi:hypothetical protein